MDRRKADDLIQARPIDPPVTPDHPFQLTGHGGKAVDWRTRVQIASRRLEHAAILDRVCFCACRVQPHQVLASCLQSECCFSAVGIGEIFVICGHGGPHYERSICEWSEMDSFPKNGTSY